MRPPPRLGRSPTPERHRVTSRLHPSRPDDDDYWPVSQGPSADAHRAQSSNWGACVIILSELLAKAARRGDTDRGPRRIAAAQRHAVSKQNGRTADSVHTEGQPIRDQGRYRAWACPAQGWPLLARGCGHRGAGIPSRRHQGVAGMGRGPAHQRVRCSRTPTPGLLPRQARRRDGIPASLIHPRGKTGTPACAISVPLRTVNHGQQRVLVTRPDRRLSALTAH